MVKINEQWNCTWKKVPLDKRHIIWINLYSGHSIAALGDLMIKLFHYQMNNQVWSQLEEFNGLFLDIFNDQENMECCCIFDCSFSPVCSLLYHIFTENCWVYCAKLTFWLSSTVNDVVWIREPKQKRLHEWSSFFPSAYFLWK